MIILVVSLLSILVFVTNCAKLKRGLVTFQGLHHVIEPIADLLPVLIDMFRISNEVGLPREVVGHEGLSSHHLFLSGIIGFNRQKAMIVVAIPEGEL